MNLQNYYYYFQSVIPSRLCDDIIKHAKLQQEQIAVTGDVKINDLNKKNLSKEEAKNLKKIRNSNVVWLNDTWIYREIHPYISEANKLANWNFEWDWSESCQFTKYGTGQYYHWHTDSWEDMYNTPENINTHGKIRKLSVTCTLSDPSEYEGGELEFNFNNPQYSKRKNVKKCTEILPKGSLIVFPSFVWHRVRPVKSGTRYSLVIWNLGYPFK